MERRKNRAVLCRPWRDRLLHTIADSGSNFGFEAELWRTAAALHSNIDAAEYNYVELGLIPLKYISDALEELLDKMQAEAGQWAVPRTRTSTA